MARAYGWNAQLLLAFESTYGTPPVSGFKKMPFVSRDISAQQGLIASNVIGLGRDPTQPYQDAINVDGDIVVPVDLRNIGQWLKALLGAPTTTGSTAPYSHAFKSGATSLPSLSLETGLPQIPAFFMVAGVRVNSMAFNFTRSGEAIATINCIGQGETRNASTQGGTPTQANYTRFSQFQGAIKQGGSALANVTSASVTYSNNLEKIETIRADGKLDGVDPGIAALTGSVAVRYGTVRIAGNVIWAADLEEQVVTETNSASGGKGGGGSVTSTTRSYLYFASFAVGLCAGAISSVDRVWANGKLVHDSTSSLLDMAVYLGNETQSPDDRIESALGVGFVPAYRGMAYAVINRLNLSEYGNQIPNLQFECRV
jgi:hypothetical protein